MASGLQTGRDDIQSLVAKGFLDTKPRPWNNDVEDDLAHVAALFSAQVSSASVTGVYRIQSPGLGIVYEAVRGKMDVKEEQNLWHGTSVESVRNISLNGFNRAYCGKHGLKLGHGTYFSSAADYSMRFCDKNRPQRYMFFAKVLTGTWTLGSSDLREPPFQDAEGLIRYDSTVDNVDAPTMFCVFRDFQALPLYLVEFSGTAS